MTRSPAMQAALERMFPAEEARKAQGLCPVCAESIKLEEFKDDLSRREYEISGMCGKCQEKVFADPVEYEREP